MDSLPPEILLIIFSFLKDWPVEIASLLRFRRVCRRFWYLSFHDSLWKDKYLWTNKEIEDKFEHQPSWKKKVFQNRLLLRYTRFMGCYDPRVWTMGKERAIDMYTTHLWLCESLPWVFVSTSFPVLVSGSYDFVFVENHEYNNNGYSIKEVRKLVTEYLKGGLISTRHREILGDSSNPIINEDDSFMVGKRKKTIRKLFRFGIFKVVGDKN